MNVWYNATTQTYHVLCNGRHYVRDNFIDAKGLIDSLLPSVAARAMYAA